MSEIDRVRWHCRRGMLELDLVLSRFMDAVYGALAESDRVAFSKLLEYPDNDLWDLVSARAEPEDLDVFEILKQVRAVAPKRAAG